MNNQYWDKMKKPPIGALKAIGAGRLRGKTDINPQWRMQAMTETFGPCGIGWKYAVDRLWLERGAAIKCSEVDITEYEVAAFAQISLFIKHEGMWSDAIPGIGGSLFVEVEKKGPHNSDEAFKMAITDALSVAMKALGVAAEIYLGNFDGSKYKNDTVIQPQNRQCQFELDEKIIATFNDCKSIDDLKAAWESVPVGLRKNYTALKEEAKYRIGGSNA